MKKIPSIFKNKQRKTIQTALFILVAVFVGFFLGKQNVTPPSSPDTISAAELKRELKNKNFTFINVHVPYEGEIEQTDAFIAYDKIIESSSLLPEDKDAPIILYCKTGRMSEEALTTVRKLGYTNVRHLAGGMDAWEKSRGNLLDLSGLEETVLPQSGIALPVSWGDVGPRLIAAGVIDLPAFREVVQMTPEQEKILTEGSDEHIAINHTNGQFVVDMLWALGLAQKSIVYEEGPLGQEEKANAGDFASTGGWNLAKGDALAYLNRFDLIPLTDAQQRMVGDIAQNVYRPCCNASTWFPDCNHGMAALAAIELMVAAGIPEKDIYRYVLALNSYWFPDTYLTIATFFARQGTAWSDLDAKMLLSQEFSSATGANLVATQVGPLPFSTNFGGACGT